MKRSEMLRLIEKTIDAACGNDGEQRLYPSDSYLALAILKTLEIQGMLPPKATILHVERHEGFGGMSEIEAFAWEPENEIDPKGIANPKGR